jgi:hypothetical protein
MRSLLKSLCLVLAICLASACSRKKNPFAESSEPSTTNTVQTIIDDMTLPHEGFPHGVPANYDWARRPRVGMGNNPGNFRAMTAWGQVYEDLAGNLAANSRVHIRDIRAYLLSKKDGEWHALQSSAGTAGAAYVEDFAGDVNKPPDVRQEPDSGMSVTAGGGYNYHFWPTSGRASIDPADIGGIFTTVLARLVLNDSTKVDDRSTARYILSMGGDYWLSKTAAWDNFKTNGDIGIGRFKYVRSQWRAFNMSTLTAEELKRNPPPLE